jgi:hypothetical protein
MGTNKTDGRTGYKPRCATSKLTQSAAHGKDRGKLGDMQHRHFATVATIISALDCTGYDAEPEALRADIAKQFALRLADTNPRFDRERFLRACQP